MAVSDENYIRTIKWLNGEHAFILLWYRWDINNPTHITVYDTLTWIHNYETSEWIRKWWQLNNRSVIIAKDKSNTKLNTLIKE